MISPSEIKQIFIMICMAQPIGMPGRINTFASIDTPKDFEHNSFGKGSQTLILTITGLEIRMLGLMMVGNWTTSLLNSGKLSWKIYVRMISLTRCG